MLRVRLNSHRKPVYIHVFLYEHVAGSGLLLTTTTDDVRNLCVEDPSLDHSIFHQPASALAYIIYLQARHRLLSSISCDAAFCTAHIERLRGDLRRSSADRALQLRVHEYIISSMPIMPRGIHLVHLCLIILQGASYQRARGCLSHSPVSVADSLGT